LFILKQVRVARDEENKRACVMSYSNVVTKLPGAIYHYSNACYRGTELTEVFSFVGAALGAIMAIAIKAAARFTVAQIKTTKQVSVSVSSVALW